MQEPSNLVKITLASKCFKNVLTQIITWIEKDSLNLTYPSNINTKCVTVLIHTGRFFYTISVVDN